MSCFNCNSYFSPGDDIIHFGYDITVYYSCYPCFALFLTRKKLKQLMPYKRNMNIYVDGYKVSNRNQRNTYYIIPYISCSGIDIQIKNKDGYESTIDRIINKSSDLFLNNNFDTLVVTNWCRSMIRRLIVYNRWRVLLALIKINRWLTRSCGYYRVKYWTVRNEFDWHPKSQRLLQLVESWD